MCCILGSPRLGVHLQMAALSGPAVLQLQHSLTATLQKSAQREASNKAPIVQELLLAAGCAASLLRIFTAGGEIDEAEAPTQALCLSATMACWAALEAVPAIASMCEGTPQPPLLSALSPVLGELGGSPHARLLL